MMSKMVCVTACVAVAALAGVSFGAVALEDVELSEDITAVGADGDNLSVCVIDFGETSYAFGYRWDDAADGEDMLLALDAQTALAVDYTTYSFGIGINSLSYAGETIISDGWATTFPGYWTCGDGESWVSSSVGVSDRTLAAGSFDGWSQESVANGFTAIFPPTTPVPEPAGAVLLAIGAAVAIGRRKRV